MAAVRYLVSGRVQGVGFRMFVLRSAQQLHLRGWARNRADGTVEIQAWGPEALMERLALDLRRGPQGAWVESVTCEAASGEAPPEGFTIL